MVLVSTQPNHGPLTVMYLFQRKDLRKLDVFMLLFEKGLKGKIYIRFNHFLFHTREMRNTLNMLL